MVVSDSFQSSTLPIGFTYLDLDNTTDIRIYCNTYSDGGTIKLNLSNWGNTFLHAAQSNWLDVLAIKDPNFQWGSFSTADANVTAPIQQATRQIIFPVPYSAPPVIIVWLNELEISSTLFTNSEDTHSWRVNTSVSNIAPDQFTLGINTWSGTYLYSAAASWIAYPANNTVFASGTFSTWSSRTLQDVQLQNQQTVSFAEPFKDTPFVTAALNEFDFGIAANLRVSLNVSNVTSTSLTWHLNSWDNSMFYSASGSYLAWHPAISTSTSSSTVIGVSVGCSIFVIIFAIAVVAYRRGLCPNFRGVRQPELAVIEPIPPPDPTAPDVLFPPNTAQVFQGTPSLGRQLPNNPARGPSEESDQSGQSIIHPINQTLIGVASSPNTHNDNVPVLSPPISPGDTSGVENRLALLLDTVGAELAQLRLAAGGSNSDHQIQKPPPPYTSNCHTGFSVGED